MEAAKRKTVMSYLRAASDKMARAVNTGAKSPDVSATEVNDMVRLFRLMLTLEERLKKPRSRR